MSIRRTSGGSRGDPFRGIAAGIALGGIVLLGSAAPAGAEPSGPGSMTFPDIVETVKGSVVGINANVAEGTGERMHHSSSSRRESASRQAPDEGQRGPEGHQVVGSGFLISADGYVVTNAHVVEGSDVTQIKTTDAKTYTAKVVGIDAASDLALLKIDGHDDFPAAKLSEKAPRVGDWILAIGNPFGLDGTVTAGIVSADKRNIGNSSYGDFIQIDAPVNQGNSGGPAFDLDGKVVGINTMILSPSGGSIGIAFAIPVDTLKAIVPQLKEKGFVRHGWIGVRLGEITPEIAESLGLPGAEGAIVEDVAGDAPAAKSGVVSGDVILSIDGKSIKDPHDLVRRIVGEKPGDVVELGMRHESQDKVVSVTLGELPHPALALREKPADGSVPAAPTLGLKLSSRSGSEGGGVLVTGIDPHGSAVRRGLAIGDVIVEIGGRTVNSPDDVAAALNKAHGEGKRFVLLRLKSAGATRFVAIPPDPV